MFHTPSRCDDRLVTTSPSYCPTEDDVDNHVIRCLVCLPDGLVKLRCLGVGIRWVECIQVVDALCLIDGFEELFRDDDDIDRDVCVTDGVVGL